MFISKKLNQSHFKLLYTINMSKLLLYFIWAFYFCLPGTYASVENNNNNNKQPNIVFILADDYGWNDVGFHGSRQVSTPVLDEMANEGLILNNYYTLPMCTPSRAALMTGGQLSANISIIRLKSRHPIRTGMQHKVVVTGQRMGLPLQYKLMPEYLNDLGYDSHAVGKWHLGNFHKSYLPTYRGFKTFYGLYNGKATYYDHWELELGMIGLDWHLDEGESLTDVFEDFGQYTTRAFASRAEKLIDEHSFESKPMFLYVPLQAPHSALYFDALQAPRATEDEITSTYHPQRRKYLAMVKEMDTAVGRIKSALDKKGVLDNTIIVFSADNGGATNGFNFNWASNYPLRSSKGYFYEGSSRAVCFVWGNLINSRKGQVSTEMMHISDWLPTFYSLGGGVVGDLGDVDSYDMTHVLTGANLTSPRTEFVLNFDPLENAKAMRVGRYKYLLNPNNRYDGEFDDWYEAPGQYPGTNETMVPGTTPSQIDCGGERPPRSESDCHSTKTGLNECLFDIENDPCEYNNLVDKDDYIEVKENLLDRVKYWETQQVPPMRPPIDWDSNPKNFGYVWKPWTDDPTIPENEDYECNPKHCPPAQSQSKQEL